MVEEKTKTQQKETEVKPDTTPSASKVLSDGENSSKERGRNITTPSNTNGPKKTFVRRGGPRRTRKEKFKPEFDQKILGIRRVTRVMAGGRRFSFSVAMAAGDKKGRVGVGLGKGADTAVAIEKAFNNAKKNMVKLPLGKDGTLPHPVEAKYTGSRVLIMPAPGKGLVAGGAVRTVLDLGGVHDVSAKILSRSKNALNNARVCMKALSELSPEPLARREAGRRMGEKRVQEAPKEASLKGGEENK